MRVGQPCGVSVSIDNREPKCYDFQELPYSSMIYMEGYKMQFPNAAKGIKNLWVAEILSIIAAVLTIVMAFVFVSNFKSEIAAIELAAATGTEAALQDSVLTQAQSNAILATGGLGLGMAIFGVIAFILGLIGTFQAKKDEKSFMDAFMIVVVGIVLSIVAAFLKQDSEITRYVQIASNICIAWMNYYVLLGVANLATAKGETDLHDSAKRASIWVAIAITISEVIQLFANNTRVSNQTLMIVLTSVAAVLEIVAYVYYLIVLSRARKMLEA